MQLGVVTNGTHSERLLEIASRLETHDWLRFSLDAATETTYQMIHNPHGKGNTLESVLRPVRDIKHRAPSIMIGYSYVVCWDGLVFDGIPVPDNIDEIPLAAELAAQYGFDYLSLKPCLVKEANNPVETLALREQPSALLNIRRRVEKQIEDAYRRTIGELRIHLSLNLIALLQNRLTELREQPHVCHIGFFRQVVSPLGVFHCPAFRGDPVANVADATGYTTTAKTERSRLATANRLLNYDAQHGCRNIACIYNGVNHAIEKFISGADPVTLDVLPDAEFFL